MQITKHDVHGARSLLLGRGLKGKAGAVLGVLALATFSYSGWAVAGNNFANVKATAECTPAEPTDALTVLVGLVQTKDGSIDPAVGNVTVYLEEHVRGVPKFSEVTDSAIMVDKMATVFQFLTGDQGDTVDVHAFDYSNICTGDILPDPDDLNPPDFTINSDANAIRAVVEVEVTNSNTNRRNQLGVHTARCISFPNPCSAE
ncbi:MAG: hypothetical protein OER85_15025 [Gammaproteobacteria bacterium]|nr:hypothetical protein [Gammaproteobacteria bacterium]